MMHRRAPRRAAGLFRATRRPARTPLRVEALEGRTNPGALVGLNFTGNTLTDAQNLGEGTFAPPDTMGEVGPGHVVQLTNGVFAVYDKSTGNLIGSKTTDRNFWTTKVGLSFSGGVSDTRLRYDPASGRWFAVEITTVSTGNQVLLGRSDTGDPTGTWKGVKFTANSGFGDYPTLGVDADAIYVGTNNFTSSSGSFTGESLFSIPKADIVAATPTVANMSSFQNLNSVNYGFTLQGAVNAGASNGHGAVLAISNNSAFAIERETVSNPGGPGATLSNPTQIGISSYLSGPQAGQPDGTHQIDTIGDRFSANVYQVGNLLYAANTIGLNGHDAIGYYVLNESTNAIVAQGTIGDPSFDFFQPSITANTLGQVVIGYNRSGTSASGFISSYASVGFLSGNTVAFDPPLLLKAGAVNYHLFGGGGERWGDFSATRVDPSNPSVFWTFQEYPAASNVWATQVTQIFAPTTQVSLDGSGNLTVTDISATGQNDNLTIAADAANGRYVISDPSEILGSTVSGSSQPDAHTVYVPFGAVTGSQIIFNTLAGNDTLTADNSLGTFSKTIVDNGGTGTNALRIANGAFANAAFSYTNATDGGGTLGGGVNYTGLASLDMPASTVASLTLNLPAGADSAFLEDDGVAGNGVSRFRSSPGTFVPTTFPNPTASLTVNANGADTVNLAPLDSGFATPALTFAGSGTTNTFRPTAANVLPDTAAVTVNGSVNFTLNGFSDTIGSLAGNAAATLTLTAGNTLTAGGNNASTQFDGTVNGAGGLVKAGTGNLKLTANSAATFTGPTTVSAGALVVDGSTAGSAVGVAGGATLGGTGAVGPVTTQGGAAGPGDPPSARGILAGASADFSAGGGPTIQIAGFATAGTDYDRLQLTGALTLGGNSALTLDLAGLATTGTAAGVILFGSRTGTFKTVTLLNNPNNFQAVLTYSATGLAVTLTAPATHFAVSAPAAATAGTAFSFTVTALDQFNNTALTYGGVVHFTSTDPAAVLPADGTLTNGAGTFSATLKTAGNQKLIATDTTTGSITGSSGIIAVSAAAATHFTLSAPATSTAGSAFSVTVTALDAFGNTATGYTGTAHFTSSDPQATLPGNYTFKAGDAGVHTFTGGVTLKTAGGQTVSAADTADGTITGGATVAVTPAAAASLTVLAPAAATAGAPFSVNVVALDPFNNVATGYLGTVHFTSSDGRAVLPADYNFLPGDNGAHTFTNLVTLKTAGDQTVTAADTLTSSITGGTTVTVNAAAATHLSLGAPASATAGSAFSVTVTALDAFGNTATGYTGTVAFGAGGDPLATLPGNYSFTVGDSGVHTFPNGVTLRTASAGRTLAVADTADGSVTGSATVAVTPAAASHFGVSAPASATAGSAFSVTVTALDPFNNTATGYTGTVHFTSGDPQAALPADYTFTGGDVGAHTFTGGVTLKTAGGQTVTAADTADGAVTGTSNTVTVGAAAASHLGVSAPATATAGAAFSVTVTALDQYGNVATGYLGTVQFSAPADQRAVLPANYPFTAGDAGQHTFTGGVTFKTAGTQTLTATDTGTGTITGSAPVTVSAAAATHFIVSAPAATAGTAFSVTVTALDAFGNTAAGYRGTVRLSSDDSRAVLPGDYAFTPGDNGTHTFANGVTLKTAGTRTLTAADGTVSGGTTVAVSPAAVASLAFVQQPQTGQSQLPFGPAVTVRALDAFGNAVADGTVVSVTAQGTGAAVGGPTTATTVNGVATFTGLQRGGSGLNDTLLAGSGGVTAASAPFTSVLISHVLPAVVPVDIYGPHPNATADEAFVRGLYRIVLDRDAAPAEVAAYVQALHAGAVSRSKMIDNFWDSPENRGREAVGYYEFFLGREPSQTEVDFYVQALQSGVTEEQIVSNFLHSPESDSFTDAVYVQRLYQGALGRVPSDQEVAFYVDVLQTKQATRDDLVRNFLHSPESAALAVDSFYLAYLRREASPAEQDAYVSAIGAGTLTYAATAKAVLNAPEFYDNGQAEVP